MSIENLVMPKNTEVLPSVEEGIGKICMAWSALEHLLAAILAELLETDHATAIITSAALDFRHRRDLVMSLAEFKIDGTDAFNQLNKFMSQVNGMAKERNSAVHAIWYQNGAGQDQRILMRNRGVFKFEMKPLSARHLLTVSKKIARLIEDGVRVRRQVAPATRAWRERHPAASRPLVSGKLLFARVGAISSE